MGPMMLMSFFYVSRLMGACVSHARGRKDADGRGRKAALAKTGLLSSSSCVATESGFLIPNKRK